MIAQLGTAHRAAEAASAACCLARALIHSLVPPPPAWPRPPSEGERGGAGVQSFRRPLPPPLLAQSHRNKRNKSLRGKLFKLAESEWAARSTWAIPATMGPAGRPAPPSLASHPCFQSKGEREATEPQQYGWGINLLPCCPLSPLFHSGGRRSRPTALFGVSLVTSCFGARPAVVRMVRHAGLV